jgi:hypothetical protein
MKINTLLFALSGLLTAAMASLAEPANSIMTALFGLLLTLVRQSIVNLYSRRNVTSMLARTRTGLPL